MDPADCGRGQLTFTTDHVTIDVPAAEQHELAYTLVSSSADHAVVNIAGESSEITLDVDGTAHWRAPGLGGRVGRLSFVRLRSNGR